MGLYEDKCFNNYIFILNFTITSVNQKKNQQLFFFSGAFLIPFMIMLILEGIPLFLIELGMGQKMRLGSLGVWNTIHPWLGGIGISSCIVTLFVALYYNVIITWCFFYLFNSFRVSCYYTSNNWAVLFKILSHIFSSNCHGLHALTLTVQRLSPNVNRLRNIFGTEPHWMCPHRWTTPAD